MFQFSFSFNPRKLLTVAVAGLLTYRSFGHLPMRFFTVVFAKRLFSRLTAAGLFRTFT